MGNCIAQQIKYRIQHPCHHLFKYCKYDNILRTQTTLLIYIKNRVFNFFLFQTYPSTKFRVYSPHFLLPHSSSSLWPFFFSTTWTLTLQRPTNQTTPITLTSQKRWVFCPLIRLSTPIQELPKLSKHWPTNPHFLLSWLSWKTFKLLLTFWKARFEPNAIVENSP